MKVAFFFSILQVYLEGFPHVVHKTNWFQGTRRNTSGICPLLIGAETC